MQSSRTSAHRTQETKAVGVDVGRAIAPAQCCGTCKRADGYLRIAKRLLREKRALERRVASLKASGTTA